jgi:hypothetical protein
VSGLWEGAVSDNIKGACVLAIPVLLTVVALLLIRDHFERQRDSYRSFDKRCEAAGGIVIGYDGPVCATGRINIDRVCVSECGKAGSR